MEYNHREIEARWQKEWGKKNIFKTTEDSSKPKFYVLDMFPYPSGAGLHVGHPLGYIASDIYARYKHLKGFNVLHPMGFDAFGLPAEQYAIQTGQHPAETTKKNIARYKEQLGKIGFNYDWDREVITSDPKYYKWTQWTFIQLFHHWFDNSLQKARPIAELIAEFTENGTQNIDAACTEEMNFTAEEWNKKSEKEQQEILLNYRLAYLADTFVNWCPELGTVLANDEVSNGVSVRGGYPVEQRKMRQWLLRVSAYAERLLNDLETLEWSDSLKEIQRNWIGKSTGAELNFKVQDSNIEITVFTTRPDTIYGASFMVLAPESELVPLLTTDKQKAAVADYLTETKKRTERERLAEVKKITGVFSGSYAIHPITGNKIPIWIADYVLAGYGTGAVMAVPAHDSRDFAFAKHFELPIIQVISKQGETPTDTSTWTESYDSKEGIVINSPIIDGLTVKTAIEKMIRYFEEQSIGKKKINYRLRDAIFSRQRYWGEPFPVYYKDGMPYTLDEKDLPLELPEVDKFLPTQDGQPPLARAKNWKTKDGYPLETSTMPGFAGSSGYYLRYMDPHNDKAYFSKDANRYWQDVDLYIGGTEHATGHLIYSRFWNKFLYDTGLALKNEPFKKLINQGMIQGVSAYIYRVELLSIGETTAASKPSTFNDLVSRNDFPPIFISANLKNKKNDIINRLENLVNQIKEKTGKTRGHIMDITTTKIRIDIRYVNENKTLLEKLRESNDKFKNAEFISDNNDFICDREVEKMSKSYLNVINPDNIVEEYGADTLRLYEMFLGPIEQSKPWDTNGIDGVHKFLKKLWRLFFRNNEFLLSDDDPTEKELKILHKTIKKIVYDIEHFSFNTSVSAFMICVNELTSLKCNKRQILEPLLIILSPFAPHITEELWALAGHHKSIYFAEFPDYDEKYLQESMVEYPVSFNGKVRFKLSLPADMPKENIENTVVNHEFSAKWLQDKTPKKIIVVPGRIINVVV